MSPFLAIFLALVFLSVPSLWASDLDYKLVQAAESGDLDGTRKLLSAGTNIEARHGGDCPLTAAAANGHLSVVSELLERRANINSRNSQGQTALFRASYAGHTAVVRALIEKGAEVDARDSNARTPLFVAAERGHLNILRILLEKGADAAASGGLMNISILEAAEMNHHSKVVTLLRERLPANASTESTRSAPSPQAIDALRKLVGPPQDERAEAMRSSARQMAEHKQAPFQDFRAFLIKRQDGSSGYWCLVAYWDEEEHGSFQIMIDILMRSLIIARQQTIILDWVELIPVSPNMNWRAVILADVRPVKALIGSVLDRAFSSHNATLTNDEKQPFAEWAASWNVMPIDKAWHGHPIVRPPSAGRSALPQKVQ
jgi:hypothetical protein